MELRVLNYFLTVADMGSFTKAANKLHITQPTLSRQIALLEEEIGCPLFVRSTRRLELTREGTLLARRAREISELTNIVRQELATSRTEIQGTVSLGCGDFAAVRSIGTLFAAFHELYPSVNFRMHSASAEDIREYMTHGLLDFGIVPMPVSEGYHSMPLPEKERWVVLLPKGHALCTKEAITPNDLKDVPLILPHNILNEESVIAKWFGETGKDLNVICENNLTANTSMLVASGLGSALVMEGSAGFWNDSICIRPMRPAVASKVALIWKENVSLNPVTARFLSFVQKELNAKV